MMAATTSTARPQNKLNLTMPSDREIRMERVLDAPRELVWKAFTDPNLLREWWGPSYLSMTIDKMDLRVGGKWRFIQRDKDGNIFAFNGEFREIVPPERIVKTMEFELVPGHIVLETLMLEEHGGKTKLTADLHFASKEDRDGMYSSGMESGASESYDRLDALLRGMQ